jgi:hypothetical protein
MARIPSPVFFMSSDSLMYLITISRASAKFGLTVVVLSGFANSSSTRLAEGSRVGPSADDITDVLLDIWSSPGNLPVSRDALPILIKACILVISLV